MCYACIMQSAMHNTCIGPGCGVSSRMTVSVVTCIMASSSPMTCRLLGLQRLKSR